VVVFAVVVGVVVVDVEFLVGLVVVVDVLVGLVLVVAVVT
jgi:hypothetical protein